MRFKLDENLPGDLTSLLITAGHDAHTVVAERLGGRPDPDVLGAAKTEGRILLTFDTDFADIRAYPLGSHAGIVVFRLRDQRWRTLRPPVERLLADGVLDTIAGGLAIVEDDRIRVRRGAA